MSKKKTFVCIKELRSLSDKRVVFFRVGQEYIGERIEPQATNYFNETRPAEDEVDWKFINNQRERHLIPEGLLNDYFDVKYNYYEEQLNSLDLTDERFTIKISSGIRTNNQTKWMDLNNESIKVVTEFLQEKMLKKD